MDFHKFDHISIEDVITAHMADESVQERYGVKYHQFWVNQEAGTVFCLVEGPDMETCETVHRVAHGNVACALVEVEPGFYTLFMGDGHKLNRGIVQKEDGSPDLGYRIVLVISLYERTQVTGSKNNRIISTPVKARRLAIENILEFNGRELKWATDDSLIGVFNDSTEAIRCALQIQNQLMASCSIEKEISFKMGIGAGQPVTSNAEFFTEAIQLAHHLNQIARENEILISSLVKNLCKEETLLSDESVSIKAITEYDDVFISNLLTITEKKLSDEEFTIATLSHDIGLSRPQLYRKITSLTGRSPNDLIRDIRMDIALNLLKRKSLNISEVALEVGYNNASYFSKCFCEKFGCTPSEFVQTLSHSRGFS